MHAKNNSRAIAFESPNYGDVPKRVAAVHHRAEQLSGDSFELVFGAVTEFHFSYMPPKVELRIEFPTGKAEAEWCGHYVLHITWQ